MKPNQLQQAHLIGRDSGTNISVDIDLYSSPRYEAPN